MTDPFHVDSASDWDHPLASFGRDRGTGNEKFADVRMMEGDAALMCGCARCGATHAGWRPVPPEERKE